MLNLINQIYKYGAFERVTEHYYEYSYRRLRLRLYYNDNGIYKIKGGVIRWIC